MLNEAVVNVSIDDPLIVVSSRAWILVEVKVQVYFVRAPVCRRGSVDTNLKDRYLV